MNIIGKLFDTIKRLLADLFSSLFNFLLWLIEWLLKGLTLLLKPIIMFFDAVFYFIYKLGLLLVDVFLVVLGVGKLVVALVVGGARTIQSLSYDGRSANLGGMSDTFALLKPLINVLYLDIIAGIGVFAIWLFTYYAAHKIIQEYS